MNKIFLTLLKIFFIMILYAFIMPFGSVDVYAVSDLDAAESCELPPNQFLGGVLTTIDPNAKNILPPCSSIQTSTLGFQIPSLGDILTFAIRAFFVIAGIAALFYMLIGAFSWVTSGGEEEAVTGARNKIQAAVIGMILIVGVLAIIWTLEQVIFNRRICLGLSCTLTLPGLVKVTDDGAYCCVCLNQSTNARGQIINTSKYRCNDAGMAVAL